MSKDPNPFPGGLGRRSDYSVLDSLADIVSEAYLDERRRWERERGSAAKKFNICRWRGAFRNMARSFVRNEIMEYQAYIHLQFESRKMTRIPPTPKQCYGKVAHERWQEFQRDSSENADRLKVALRNQQELLLGESVGLRETVAELSRTWAEDEIRSYILLDATLELSALFRYGVALESDLHHVADAFRERALLQYMFARSAYDDAWGDRIPPDLRRAAKAAMLEIEL